MTFSGQSAQPVVEDQGSSTRRSRRAGRAAVAVLVTGLVFAAISAIMWARTDRANDRKDFHAVAQDVSSTVGILLQRDTNFVATLRTVLTMDPRLTPTQFEEWYSRLQTSQRQVGGIGSAGVAGGPAADLERFQAQRDADPAFIRLLGSSIAAVAPTGQRQYCLLASSGALTQLPTIAARMVQQ